MTRTEFNCAVKRSYDEFKQSELAKTPQEIFCDSYKISTIQSIKDYLIDSDDEIIDLLFGNASSILLKLYSYEWNYSEPMWCTWDNIRIMIKHFIADEDVY